METVQLLLYRIFGAGFSFEKFSFSNSSITFLSSSVALLSDFYLHILWYSSCSYFRLQGNPFLNFTFIFCDTPFTFAFIISGTPLKLLVLFSAVLLFFTFSFIFWGTPFLILLSFSLVLLLLLLSFSMELL